MIKTDNVCLVPLRMERYYNMHIADQSFIKNQNQRVILNELMKHEQISRAKLAKITKLNKATISSQVSFLIEKKLVKEVGTGLSSGGRKPVMLVFNEKAGYAIGVDIGVTYILTVLTDLDGNMIYSDYCEIEDPSFEMIKPVIIERIRLVASKVSSSPYGIIGIGAGVHGFVDMQQNVLFTPNSGWRDVDLKGLLQTHFDCPVLVDNEANAGAYGEKLFGILKGCKNGIYVSIGIGIGLGIIVNDELYRGKEGFSGEMGHMSIDFNGRQCGCGNKGCWELYASEKAFYDQLCLVKNKRRITLEEVTNWVKENDGETLRELDKLGYFLGIGLTNIINTFNPEAIVLRSNLIQENPTILNSIQSTIASRVSKYVRQNHRIYLSQLHRNATAVGAAAFIVHHFLMESEELYGN